MMRWLAFIGLLSLVLPAYADMYPDASNAKLPDARTNLGAAPHVANNVALIAASTAVYPSGVWRDDFQANLHAPPLWYAPKGSACSLNAGNGDNGSQVKSADGRCWIAAFGPGPVDAREWGVTFDGVTDDTAAFQAVVVWQNSTGGAITFPPFGGTALISQTLAFTVGNIAVRCPVGRQTAHTAGVIPTVGGCWFKAKTGSALSYLMSVVAPSGNAIKGVLTGIDIHDISFDGNNGDAKGALHLTSLRNSDVRVYAQNFSGGEIFTVDVVHATPTTFGDTCDTQNNNFDFSAVNLTFTSNVVGLHGWVNPALGTGGCNVSFNNIKAFVYFGASGAGTSEAFIDEGNDNNEIQLTALRGSGGGSNALDITVRSDGGNLFPTLSEHFIHFSSAAPILIRGKTSFPACVSGSTCPYGIVFADVDNGNGTVAPTVEPGIRPYIDYNYLTTTNKGLGPVSWPTSPVLTCSGGTVTGSTVNAATWSKNGSQVVAGFDITIGTPSACSSIYSVTLPTNAAGPLPSGFVSGINGTTGALASGFVSSGTQTAALFFTANPIAGNRIQAGMVYNTTTPP